jgi:hypothetical protein
LKNRGDDIEVKIVYFIVAFILAVTALFYVWLRIEQMRYGYIISQRYEYLLELRRTNEKLKLEWNLLTSPTNLQEIAEKEFSMRPPKQQEIIFLPAPPELIQDTEKDEGLESSCS